jgi:hypothetical protein
MHAFALGEQEVLECAAGAEAASPATVEVVTAEVATAWVEAAGVEAAGVEAAGVEARCPAPPVASTAATASATGPGVMRRID